MTSNNDWQQRHRRAMRMPTGTERRLVELIDACDALSRRNGTDYVLDEGIAQIIKGTRVLLNGSWGDRLDMGTLDATLIKCAQRIGFDLDAERFVGGE